MTDTLPTSDNERAPFHAFVYTLTLLGLDDELPPPGPDRGVAGIVVSLDAIDRILARLDRVRVGAASMPTVYAAREMVVAHQRELLSTLLWLQGGVTH